MTGLPMRQRKNESGQALRLTISEFKLGAGFVVRPQTVNGERRTALYRCGEFLFLAKAGNQESVMPHHEPIYGNFDCTAYLQRIGDRLQTPLCCEVEGRYSLPQRRGYASTRIKRPG